MTFASLPVSSAVFLDANTLVYHFANDPKHGAACSQLFRRIEGQQLQGFTSTHALADVAHRLMTLEAIASNGWPAAGIAARCESITQKFPNSLSPVEHWQPFLNRGFASFQ